MLLASWIVLRQGGTKLKPLSTFVEMTWVVLWIACSISQEMQEQFQGTTFKILFEGTYFYLCYFPFFSFNFPTGQTSVGASSMCSNFYTCRHLLKCFFDFCSNSPVCTKLSDLFSKKFWEMCCMFHSSHHYYWNQSKRCERSGIFTKFPNINFYQILLHFNNVTDQLWSLGIYHYNHCPGRP